MEPSCRHLARSAELPEIQPQQVAELAPVPDREVLIAVVHENVRFTRLVGEGLDPRNPFLELFLRVVVTEPDARRVALRLRSEEHTSELQSRGHLVCRLLLE